MHPVTAPSTTDQRPPGGVVTRTRGAGRTENTGPIEKSGPIEKAGPVENTGQTEGGLPWLQHWDIVRPLGSGSWSQVYQARPRRADPRGPADYVIKLVPDEIPRWKIAVGALEREVSVAHGVSHRNLVSVLMVHLHAMPCYTVMPYLPGVTLRRLLDEQRLPLALSLWIARQIAEALVALHAGGWAHADIKPQNILVSPQGHATLIDLGLARRLVSDECGPNAPRVGTPAYMPPEMARGSDETTSAVDIYSLGVTFREMLTGQRPEHSAQGTPGTGIPTRGADNAIAPGDSGLPASVAGGRVGWMLDSMLAPSPQDRPSAETLTSQLSSLEIKFFEQRCNA